MNTNLIRWTKEDKQNLRRAVNNFNNKIRRLEKLGVENLPEKVSYRELVGLKKLEENEISKEIYSRRELNNIINSLQRFSRRGAEEMTTLDGGQQLTKWARNELRINKARATRNIKKEIGDVNTSFGMGEAIVQTLKGTLKTIENINNKKGYEFNRVLDIINNRARSDRELRRAIIWRENYYKRLESLKNFDNYDLLINKLDSISNPVKMYEYVSQSEILNDLFLWTNSPEDTQDLADSSAQTYGGFKSDQEAFNTALEQLGLL